MRLPARHKLRSSACTRPPQRRHYVKTYDFSQPLILSGHKRPMSSRVKQNSNPPLRTPLNQCLGCLKGYPTFSNHKLGSDVISGPIAVTSRWSILIPPPPPPRPVAVWPRTSKNYVVPYIIYILLLRYSLGCDGPFQ